MSQSLTVPSSLNRAGFVRVAASYSFDGIIDEVRILDVARSGDWVWACWMNQGTNHRTFVTYDSVERTADHLQRSAGANLVRIRKTIDARDEP